LDRFATGGSIEDVSAQPADERPPPEDREPVISALEAALRQALAEAARERVISCIAATLPIEIGAGPGSRPHGPPGSRVQKVSVSMPAELADLVRARTGTGGFSRYVTEAVQEQVRHDLLADLSAELESEYGPVDQDGVEQAMREWPDFAEE
jgi:hypothetical protein